MPNATQIEAAAILTKERAWHLLEIVRASETFRSQAALYSDLQTLVMGLVDVADDGSDAAIQSRMLDANLTAFDEEIEDGTVAVKGGKYGADYSQSRDREDIVKRILGVLYTDGLAGEGVIVYGFNSYNLTNKAVF